MVLFPRSGLGRFLLGVIVLSTFMYLILNLVSFGGTPWVTYIDVPIQFGLWRVCDTSSGVCNQWADSQYTSNITVVTFNGGKPSFVRSSQALEIISLIFYIVAVVLIIFGVLNFEGLPYEILFMAAVGLLFICIIFLSASLGLMADQGRSNHNYSFLSWAWWNGLVGLIMTIIDFLALIAFILDMRFSPTNMTSGPIQRPIKQKNPWTRSSSTPQMAGGSAPPVLTANNLGSQWSNYPNANQQYPQQNYSYPDQYSQPNYSSHNPYPENNYSSPSLYPQNNYQTPSLYPQNNYSNPDPYPQDQQYNPNNYFSNPMSVYGDQSPAQQYFDNQSPSPIISALAREYVSQMSDAQYQNQLLAPYRQYFQDPYQINNYL